MADSTARPVAQPRSFLCPPAQQGFTLIEVLVVMVMLGVLASVALPSLLGQAVKAKQARALMYIGVVNRAQQSFFMENDRFATSTSELGFADHEAPPDYTYAVTSQASGVKMARTQAIPTNSTLRGYAGVVFTTVDPGGSARLSTVVCKGSAATTPSPTPVEVAGQVQITNCDVL